MPSESRPYSVVEGSVCRLEHTVEVREIYAGGGAFDSRERFE